MRPLIYIICVLALSFLPSQAQSIGQLFEKGTYRPRLEQAKRLNASGRYMQAFDSLRVLHHDVVSVISHSGFTPALLPETVDFVFYQNVLISEAECAYKVNLWRELLDLSQEHINAINLRYEKGLGRNMDYYWQVGAFFKIMGDYYSMRGAENSLAYYEAKEKYESAIEYFGLAEDAQAIAKVHADLAQIEYVQGNYEDALDYIDLALSGGNWRLLTGSNAKSAYANEEYGAMFITLYSALAMCQARTNDYAGAFSTIDGLIGRLPRNDRRLPELKRRKAKILLLQNEENGADIGSASALYTDYFKAIKDSVAANFMQMTADQREEYWMQERPFVADCYLLEARNPELLYDVTLYNKGMLLQTARSFDNLLYDGIKKDTDNERFALNRFRQQDAQNKINGKVTTYAADYEHELLQKMATDGRRKKFFEPLNCTWRDVQKALPTDGCAIEFVEYDKGGAMHFGALVLKKKGKPRFVHVCDADELESYTPKGTSFSLGTLLQAASGTLKNFIYEDPLIPDSIWNAELVEAIGTNRKVYFSTDGYLHQLAIEYLLPESLQSKSFYRLSSTRVLAEGDRINPKQIKEGSAFVLGGIRYEPYWWDDEKVEADPGNDVQAFRKLQEMRASFNYMEGAKVECDSIIYYRNNPGDLYLKDLDATESAFYKHCSEYPLLHISTHGAFVGNRAIYGELLPASSKDVLSESVLTLSYSCSNLRDADFDAFNKDGLLSAREVARLDLDNVELVTTSACQTGLGYITADGIYGMQRGFKSAGAKAMVMTLWSVNIESARIFFTSLYRYMAEGESVHSAFNHARNDLLTKEYKTAAYLQKFSGATISGKPEVVTTTTKYDEPLHSCPYILIDAWE